SVTDQSIVCYCDEFYITDNYKRASWIICDKNFPIMEVLAPGESQQRYLRLMRRDNSSRVTFKVGFHLIKVSSNKEAWDFDTRDIQKATTIIWSNQITMYLV